MGEESCKLSRRSLLRRAAGGAAAASLTLSEVRAALAQSLQKFNGLKVDGGYWEKIRKQFLIEEGFAYLNTGTLGATPGPVYRAMVRYWKLMAENPNENSAILQDRVQVLRDKAAAFVGASSGEIAILRNATEGNNLLVQGLDLKQGDEVLIGTLEHDSSRQPWRLKAKRNGVVVKEVPIGTPPKTPDAVLNAIGEAITPRTKVIHLAHCDTVTGTLTPVKEIAALARSKGILCFVDGAQTVGMVQLQLRDLAPDAYVMTCHKWLASPAGAGLLYIRRELHDRIWPNIVTENWWAFSDARKYDRLSRRPWPVVAALEDTLDFHLAVGPQRIEQRARALGSYLRTHSMEIPRIRLYTSDDPRLSGGITTLGLEHVAPGRVREYLRQRYDVYIAARARGDRYPADPHGVEGIRVSTHFYNTFEQVDRVLQGLKELSEGKA